MENINQTQPKTKVVIGDLLLDKKVTVHTLKNKVSYINPKVGYDNLHYDLE